MKYYLFTLGCQMNISDSQRIATKLEELGYTPASESEADLVVVNACSVRQHAVDRIWGKIKKWQKEGKEIFITGCVLKSDKKKFEEKNIQTFKITELPKLKNILNKHSPKNINCLEYFKISPKNDKKIVLIPIMTGCDNFCSYCAVPYTRGREISRPMKDVLNDIKDVLNKGFKEILLLGQNVNSYRQQVQPYHKNRSSTKSRTVSKKDNRGFTKLLKAIDHLAGDFKFNFISSNPHDMTQDIIETLTKLKKWPKELHLPMQSGDDEILHKMNRKYSNAQYLKLIENLKLKIENLILTTDIIVGFPGETKAQFNNTVRICKKIGFKKAFIGQYSPRSGTAAAKLKNNVPPDEKKRRWLVLNKLINK